MTFLKGLCHSICHLFKTLKHIFVSVEFQKNNDPVLLFKPTLRHWNCFLSCVPMDSKDRHGLKLEKTSFNAAPAKSPENYYG